MEDERGHHTLRWLLSLTPRETHRQAHRAVGSQQFLQEQTPSHVHTCMDTYMSTDQVPCSKLF